MWALLWIISIVVPASLVYVLIRFTKDEPVSTSRSTNVFNNVAVTVETLVGLGRLDEPTGQRILESLINGLTIENSWSDADEALLEHETTPFIVQAFENCGITISED